MFEETLYHHSNMSFFVSKVLKTDASPLKTPTLASKQFDTRLFRKNIKKLWFEKLTTFL